MFRRLFRSNGPKSLKSLPLDGSLPPLDGSSPPPYSPTDTSSQSVFQGNGKVCVDEYKNLSKFDIVFVIDDSSSMVGENWNQTLSALSAIVEICTKHDSDGVDIYFINHDTPYRNISSVHEVLRIFKAVSPSGLTPTGGRLDKLFKSYLQLYRKDRTIKPLNIIVITDGSATDPDKLEESIVETARELDNLEAKDRQIGVQFFQVGRDPGAERYLKRLDNVLSTEFNVGDMVDTVSWEQINQKGGLSAEAVLKVVTGAIDKRVDNQSIY